MNRRILGGILLGLTAIIWGISYVFTKVAVENIPPMTLAMFRFSLAIIVLLPFARQSKIKLSGKAHLYSALAGLFGITSYFFFENTALKYTSPSDASLIVSSAPLLTILLYDLRRRRFELAEYLGAILAFSGIAVLIYGGQFSRYSSVTGNLLAFGAAASWTAYTVFFERIAGSALKGVVETMAWGLAFIFPLSLIEILRSSVFLSVPFAAITGIVYLGIFASALGYFLWGRGIELWGGKASTLWIYTIPIFAALSDVLILKNTPSLFFYFGAAFVACGMLVSIDSYKRISETRARISKK